MNVRLLVSLGAVAFAMDASGQEACPGGTQVGQNCGGGYCVPICAYDESSQARQAPPPPRVVRRWELFDDRFGAIALDMKSGTFAMSSGHTTREEAEQAAFQRCRSGGGERCEMVTHARNTCQTLAWGAGYFQVSGGASVQSSEQKTLRMCRDHIGVECEVFRTECSLPVSRWVVSDTPPEGFVPKQQ